MQDVVEASQMAQAVVLEAYSADLHAPQPQLDLRVGDGVQVLQTSGCWAQGLLNGEIGWFPTKHVMILAGTASQNPALDLPEKKRQKKGKSSE
jgi:hypothetical protein